MTNKKWMHFCDVNGIEMPEMHDMPDMPEDGKKEVESKLIYDIDFNYITGMAERMQLNRDKYPVGNWQKPIDIESLKQALFRHVIEVMKCNYSDEQINGHLYAIGCNAFMILNQLK